MRLISIISFVFFSLSYHCQQTIDATILHGGLTREYKVYIPAIYNGSTPVPLVFNLHGYTSNNLEQLYYGDFRAIADTANFILVLPQGTLDQNGDTFWNSRFGATVDDLGFIDVLIDSIALQYNINQDRIYSTGMSNGGFMSFMLACELSNRITAIASVTGSMTTLQPNFCTPNRPVPVMQIHGTADPTVNYNGSVGVMSIPSVLNHWITNNNCNITPVVTNLPDINTSDLCTATRYDYLNGDNGSEVVHYKITGGGHTWPGSAITFVGVTNLDFNASIEIWKFFNKYTMSNLVSINETEKKNEILTITSENPFENVISFSVNTNEEYSITIVDIFGKNVYSNQFHSNMQTIDLSKLSGGYYILNLTTTQAGYSTKVVKK